MSRASSISSLYRPDRIHLWVEDPFTREYLKECWNDADAEFMFHIAGGNQGVGSIIKDAEDQDLSSVFGFVDQDFGPTNRADWLGENNTFRRFVSGVHEVENYLLDADAMAGCSLNTAGRTHAEILQRISRRADELKWWMACRRVIKQLYAEFCQGFLEHPKCPHVTDHATAEKCIVEQTWYKQIKSKVDAISTLNEIGRRLQDAYDEAVVQLKNDLWKTTFSGKELFHHVRDYVYVNHPNPNASSAELDADLARSIARWQFAEKRVPEEVTELREALRRRVKRDQCASTQ